jgi:hypothetical protein
MQATVRPVSDPDAKLLDDAFAVLDRYGTAIADRDPTKSFNEDRCELLRRVRAAVYPLIGNGAIRRDDAVRILQRLDDFLARECPMQQSAAPRMGTPR